MTGTALDRTPNDADHEVACFHVGVRRSLAHRAKRFMTDHEPAFTRGRPTIVAANDVAVGAAHADGDCAHQHRTVRGRRLGEVFDPRGIGNARRDGEGAHSLASVQAFSPAQAAGHASPPQVREGRKSSLWWNQHGAATVLDAAAPQ